VWWGKLLPSCSLLAICAATWQLSTCLSQSRGNVTSCSAHLFQSPYPELYSRLPPKRLVFLRLHLRLHMTKKSCQCNITINQAVLITAVVTFDGSRKLTSTYWRTGAGRFSRACCFYTVAHQPWFTAISSVTTFSLLAHLVLWRLEILAWQRLRNSHLPRVS